MIGASALELIGLPADFDVSQLQQTWIEFGCMNTPSVDRPAILKGSWL